LAVKGKIFVAVNILCDEWPSDECIC